jgi:CheY-like chemotaxis protein
MQVSFDLVLTDYAMPKMTGADLCRRLRQHRRYHKIPFVLITAYSCDLDIPRLQRELRFVTVVTKPFSPVDLVERVERCLTYAHDEVEATGTAAASRSDQAPACRGKYESSRR